MKLALVLGGGVSLGTYVAGAVSEILGALERTPGGEHTVEVIAGSSSGALTAAIAARALAVNPGALPWLRKVWVEAADADHLLDSGRADRSALLDATVMGELSRALITAEPASDDRPAAAMGREVRVGIALSNLDGVRFELPYGFLNVPDRSYGTRIHRDWIELRVQRAADAGDPVWERMRAAAVASASFPLAFPPLRLERERREYPGANLPGDPESGTVDMWYTDGGLFDNEPLGLAKRLVEHFPDHRSADWRYVLVDPYLETDPRDRRERASAPDSIVATVDRLARAVLGQGAALDWIRANKVNARLEILQALVDRLPELGDRLCDPAAVDVGRRVGELAERVAEMKVAVRRREPASPGPDPVVEYLDENLARIAGDPRFAPVLERVETRAARTRLAKLIFVLESAGGLRDKEPMPLYLVAPPEEGGLSGDFMANFGGFFHRPWRENDFRAGRRDARRLLEDGLGEALRYRPDPDEAYRVEPLEAGFGSLPPDGRRKLEAFVEREADRALDDLEAGFLASLLAPVWKPAVRRWAARRILRALEKLD